MSPTNKPTANLVIFIKNPMALLLYLDGRLLNADEHSDLSDAEITLRRQDESGRPARNLAQEITFYGTAYQTIYDNLILAPDARNRFLEVVLREDCCENFVWLTGRITADSIEWCEKACSVTGTVVSYASEDAGIECLRSTIVSDDFAGFRYRLHPFVRHCIEMRPALLQDLVLIFAFLFNFTLLLFYPIVTLLTLVIALVNIIITVIPCGDACEEIENTLDVNLLDEYSEFITRINSLIIGCGRGHISPFVRDYLQNVCDKCGLVPDPSSENILFYPSSPYYNTMYYYAPVHNGSFDYVISGGALDGDTIQDYWEWNGVAESGFTFLESLKKVFNAGWRLESNVLYFEHDATPPPVGLVWDDIPEDARIELCYEYTGDVQPAYARFEYSLDAVDWVGNEAKRRFNDIVDYNSPDFSPNRKGERQVVFPFGMARFRDDGVERDVLSDYQSFPFIGSLISSDFDKLLLLPVGVAFQPKLLIWDGISDFNNAKVMRVSRSGGGYDYNKDFFVQENTSDTLYDRFWASADPRLRPERGIRFKLSLFPDCDLIQNLNLHQSVMLPLGIGRINEIRHSKSVMTIIGIV